MDDFIKVKLKELRHKNYKIRLDNITWRILDYTKKGLLVIQDKPMITDNRHLLSTYYDYSDKRKIKNRMKLDELFNLSPLTKDAKVGKMFHLTKDAALFYFDNETDRMYLSNGKSYAYWVNSPGMNDYKICVVDDTGRINTHSKELSSSDIYIRACMLLDIHSELLSEYVCLDEIKLPRYYIEKDTLRDVCVYEEEMCIPSTVKRIDRYALNDAYVRYVQLPNQFVELDRDVFKYDTKVLCLNMKMLFEYKIYKANFVAGYVEYVGKGNTVNPLLARIYKNLIKADIPLFQRLSASDNYLYDYLIQQKIDEPKIIHSPIKSFELKEVFNQIIDIELEGGLYRILGYDKQKEALLVLSEKNEFLLPEPYDNVRRLLHTNYYESHLSDLFRKAIVDDEVFLLSENDINKYFKNDSELILYDDLYKSSWWIKEDELTNTLKCIDQDGNIRQCDEISNKHAIRPAMYLDIHSKLLKPYIKDNQLCVPEFKMEYDYVESVYVPSSTLVLPEGITFFSQRSIDHFKVDTVVLPNSVKEIKIGYKWNTKIVYLNKYWKEFIKSNMKEHVSTYNYYYYFVLGYIYAYLNEMEIDDEVHKSYKAYFMNHRAEYIGFNQEYRDVLKYMCFEHLLTEQDIENILKRMSYDVELVTLVLNNYKSFKEDDYEL